MKFWQLVKHTLKNEHGWVLQAIGLAAGLFGSSSAAKAQREAAAKQAAISATLMNWGSTFLQGGQKAMGMLQGLANLQKSRIGQQNPYLKEGYEQGVSGVNQDKARALAGSKLRYGATGNTGRGRGEQLRINESATDAKNQLALGYGQSQMNYKLGNEATYAGLLGQVGSFAGIGANLVSGGANAGMQSAQMEAEAGSTMANAWSGFGGAIFGMGQSNDLNKRLDAQNTSYPTMGGNDLPQNGGYTGTMPYNPITYKDITTNPYSLKSWVPETTLNLFTGEWEYKPKTNNAALSLRGY
jgi:hypothetical protein